jgi:hypothetical protein
LERDATALVSPKSPLLYFWVILLLTGGLSVLSVLAECSLLAECSVLAECGVLKIMSSIVDVVDVVVDVVVDIVVDGIALGIALGIAFRRKFVGKFVGVFSGNESMVLYRCSGMLCAIGSVVKVYVGVIVTSRIR